MNDTDMSRGDWDELCWSDDDCEGSPPGQADFMALVISIGELVQQQQRTIEQLWLKAHGTPFQPTHEQKHTRMAANVSVSLLRDFVEGYRTGRIAEAQSEPPGPATAPALLPADPEAYADIKQIAHHLGISVASIGRMIRAKRFPEPDWLSPNRMAWKAGVIRNWPGYEPTRARAEKMRSRNRRSTRR